MRNILSFMAVLAAGLLVNTSYAIETPDFLKDLNLHPIQAPPEADQTLISISELPIKHIEGDLFTLPAGRYEGNFVLDLSIHLKCEEGAILDGMGQKNTLNMRAPNAVLEGCTIVNSGQNLTDMNAGIFVERTAEAIKIDSNIIRVSGFGAWVDAAPKVQIINNKIQGDLTLRSQDRGNGIHFFAVRFGTIQGNELWHTRDGIYVDNSNDNLFDNNHLHDLRYGIHFMFSNRNTISNNLTQRTRTGLTLMQSRQLTAHNNRSEFDQNYGILMNYITYSTISDNYVTDVQEGQGDSVHIQGGEGKGIFIYNSLFNTVTGNEFHNSTLGIHLTAGSEDNKIYRNSFINNQSQVKYVAVRHQEWSVDGVGNYWADYLGWDRNNDGIGDIPYEPNDNVDKLLWTYPQVKLLMNSPSIELLRWVQQIFPVVKYPGVQDSYPLMEKP